MAEFTKAAHAAPDIPGVENWRGVRVGQEWTRVAKQHRDWPQGRVYVTDLIIRNGALIVKFLDYAREAGRERLELGLDSFLREFKQ